MSPTIAVVNCNTTETMTDSIAAAARASARPGTEILALTPRWGVTSAEGWVDSFMSASAVLDTLSSLPSSVDAVVMAGFGEHGREGAREMLDIPVIDITEAAAMLAMTIGRRYGVVTTVPRAIGIIEDSLLTAGLAAHCASITATDIGVLQLETDPLATAGAFVEAAERAIQAGAEVICLGCAGFAGLADNLRERISAPVIDGVTAAVGLAETLITLGLKTSSIGAYAPMLEKVRTLRN